MNRNLEYLRTITPIDDETFVELQKISTFRLLEKNTAIAKEGEVPTKRICLLLTGLMRAYIDAESGKQYNKKIFTPMAFVGPLTGIITNKPSKLTYETLTECKVFEIDFGKFMDLCKVNTQIANLYIKVLENVFMEYERRSLELMSMDATQRYLKLRERIPNIDDLIPQFQIASFLNITPVQLSRIRKKLN